MYESGYGRQESPGVVYRRQGERFKDYERVLDDFDGNTSFQALIMNICGRLKETGQMACPPFTDPAFRAEPSCPTGQVV